MNFNPAVSSLLLLTGWHPERFADASEAFAALSAVGIEANSHARPIIHALHPLTVTSPTVTMSFDVPDALARVESRELTFLDSTVAPCPCPVGTYHYGPLLVAADGRTIWLDDIGVGYIVFQDFASALEKLRWNKCADLWRPLPDSDDGAEPVTPD